MNFPSELPRGRILFILFGIYAVIWAILEGNIARDVVMSGLTLALVGWSIARRVLAGRAFGIARWLPATTLVGLAFGLGLTMLTLFFMALKTGLHAHGPEYTLTEIAWVWQQLLLWVAVGGVVGLGLGLISAGLQRKQPPG